MPNPTCGPTLIDQYWGSVPPAWQLRRSQIRRIAVEKFQTSRSAVSKAAEALVHKSLVSHQQDGAPVRRVLLALTDEGQRGMTGIYADLEQWLSARFARLNAQETKSLLQGLESLRKAFSAP